MISEEEQALCSLPGMNFKQTIEHFRGKGFSVEKTAEKIGIFRNQLKNCMKELGLNYGTLDRKLRNRPGPKTEALKKLKNIETKGLSSQEINGLTGVPVWTVTRYRRLGEIE